MVAITEKTEMLQTRYILWVNKTFSLSSIFCSKRRLCLLEAFINEAHCLLLEPFSMTSSWYGIFY